MTDETIARCGKCGLAIRERTFAPPGMAQATYWAHFTESAYFVGGYHHEPEPMNEYVIHLAPGTPERGLWCDRCQLPSVIRVPVNGMTTDGVTLIGEALYCVEHTEETQ